MSNISYQLRKLGDYTGDGQILRPGDLDIAKDILTDTEYNSLVTTRLAFLKYTTSSVKDKNNRFEKISSDARELKSGNLLAVECNLDHGCKGASAIEESEQDNKFLKIINVRQPDDNVIEPYDRYKIYFLGNEIVELLVEFDANNPSITYSDKFKKIFENLISTDNPGIEINKDLKAVKQYDNKLYVARLSNKDKSTFGRNEPDNNWDLEEIQQLENHLLLKSSEPITSIKKIRFGSDVSDVLLDLLDSDSNTINPDYISISTEIIDKQ